MKFETSIESRDFLSGIFVRVGARNQAILGRAALFLALGEGLPSDFKPKDAKGVTLNDDQVVGDDLMELVRAALNHRCGRSLDEAGYRQEFRKHFEFGCLRLKQLWEESGNDQARFVAALLKLTSGLGPVAPGKAPTATLPLVETEVRLKVLLDAPDAPDWSLNGPGTNNGLLVVSGQPGTGKSQLALDLLAQLSNCGVRFVFFDMKGELEDDPSNPQQRKNRTRFLEQSGARHIRLIRHALPINPLYRHSNPTKNAQVAYEIAGLIRCFAPQLGAKQERNISDAYQRLSTPDFPSLAQELRNSGANGVDLAIVEKVERLSLFSRANAAIMAQEWLSGSLVVDFKEFGNDSDTKALAVALILNFLTKSLNQNVAVKNDIQPIKMVLFVDEAHLLLPKEHKAGLLTALARQGRSWGFPVWLASQDADKFLTTGTNETNFAELADCGVHFSPQTLSDSQQRNILGGVIHNKFKKGEAAVRLQDKLITGSARQYWREGGTKSP
ncbi:MAG: type IV secretory system conjugative DNA transfer family protein [Acidobacteria bacterium]|nr:type IV secretory system conjugative DNA transfer family protein [Acidobacteriota bacterium]